MNTWVMRRLSHPNSPDEVADALAIVERMATTLEYLSKCDTCTAGNDQLRVAVRNVLTEYREGPQ